MSRLEITADHAELVSRRLGEIMSNRVRRKAVNKAGSEARRDLAPLIAEIYSTSRASVGARGKAASPGASADDIAYRLRFNRMVRLSKLKASARRFLKGRGPHAVGLLAVTQPQPGGSKGRDFFRAHKGEERGEFILKARRGRRERRVGGPIVSLRHPGIRRRVDRIGQDLAQAMLAEMEAALSKGRR